MTRKLHNPKAYTPSVYIPCWLIQVPIQKLSHGAKILYGRLAQWSNEKGVVYRASSSLKEEMGCSLRTITDLLKELREAGLIGTYQKEKGGVNHYEFYSHPWMDEPINEHLSYKDHPTQNPAIPYAESCYTHTQNPAYLNIKEIERNNINNIRTSDNEVLLGKNPLHSVNHEINNQTLDNIEKKEGLEGSNPSTKSDYQNKQSLNCTVQSNIKHYDIKNILENNIFQIPEEIIQDWIAHRKKKRATITQGVWKRLNKELSKCKERGIDPIDAFETMMYRGWVALDVDWLQQNQKKTASQWDVDSVMRA